MPLNQADLQYNSLVQDVIYNGTWDKDQKVRTVWADGKPAYTKSVISRQFRFDNSEVPILTTKRVAWKTAIKELLWIWQMKSNDVRVLQEMGVKIWDEWMLPDFTIGKAYGYQLGKKNRVIKLRRHWKGNYWTQAKKVDQVDYLIHELKNNPASRRHITTLWNPDDLEEMSLTPCVYETQWYVRNGKLSLEVRCRSNDLALGNPFNVFQYNVLHRMIAQVTGYELGEYIFNIGDAHIYERHIEPLTEQINRESYEAPTLWINPEVKNFYDFTIDDFELRDYKHGDTIKMEVAI
ncbi:thymidylate synthase [Priestia megaterium]|uniref:thymidylate synthase n=1 Tax=Priestia megaterium TaxID=1404 RepID=UPI000BFCBFB5|nr:thymidylate synthase [Priestia megaterium]PGO60766.1 thymidylate synthase [Priestia megaterium]